MSEHRKTTAIVAAPVLPLVTPEEAAKQWAKFEALKAKLLVDDDYQIILGKRFIKRSGFRKIAVYFGISDRIVEAVRTDREDDSFSWRMVVEAEAPNGRICVGVGACDSRERKFAHPEHDIYAICHTRAKSRAISDMVAGGAVSAEEMEAKPEEYGREPPKTITIPAPVETDKTEPGQVLAYLKDVLRQVMKKDIVYTPATIIDLIRVDVPWASENDVGTIMQQLLKIKEVEQVYEGGALKGWRKTEKAKSEVTGAWTISKIQDVFPKKLEKLVEFEETAEWILIRPKGYLGGDNFGKVAAIIRDQLKGEYISAGKDSHFRVPKKVKK